MGGSAIVDRATPGAITIRVFADALQPASLDESAERHVGTALAPHQYDA
jgi:hypothetical protein